MDGASRPGKVMLRDSPGVAAQVHLSKNPKLGSVADTCGEGSYAVTVAPKPLMNQRRHTYFPGTSWACFVFCGSGAVGWLVLQCWGWNPELNL